MATVIGGNQVKLNNGQVVNAQQGGWYDSQQFWGGSLSNAGQINAQSNQQGAGQQVSSQVVAQTNPANVAYIQQQQKQTPQQPQGQPQGQSTPGGGISGAGGVEMPQTPTIDLPGLYDSLYKSSGITDIEKELNDKTTDHNLALNNENDNPYLSEATRVGRTRKIEDQYTRDTQALRDQIATKKADIETQLNLQTKQFDINSQAAKDAFDKFNSLLQSGALNNASGDDIANITRATGISSSMIYSAIKAQADKSVDTQVVKDTNDAGEVTLTVINSKTGDIISKQNLGAVGNAQTGGSGTAKPAELNSKAIQLLEANKNSYGHVGPDTWQQILAAYIASGGTRETFLKTFSQYTDLNRGDFNAAYGFDIKNR